MKCATLIGITLLSVYTVTHAQRKPAKWGEVPPEDLKMTVYPLDSTAKAAVLQDHGQMFVFVDDSNRPSTRMSRQRRIKIFSKDAFEEGNIFIPYTHKVQNVSDVRAIVIHPNGTTTKVKSENIFTEKTSDRWSAKKIFIPNLEVGSVVEYGYTLEEEGIILPDKWYFQDNIPTRFSKFEFEYPELYEYVAIKHYGQMPSYEDARVTNRESGRGFGASKLVETVTEFENLPAIKSEPFMTTTSDYMSRLGYQLKSYTNNYGMIVPVFSTWENLVKELEENQAFGGQYLRKNASNDLVKAYLVENPKPPTEKLALAQSILSFVSNQIKWSQYFSLFVSEKNVDEAFKKKQGNSSDLNLAVLALCKEFGLEAYPVLISTRSHGSYIEAYPILSQFNSVLASVIIDGKLHLLDATSPFHAVNMVDEEHSNYYGWIARKDKPGFVEVKPLQYQEIIFYKAKLNPDMSLSGDMALRLGGKAGVDFRAKAGAQPDANLLKARYTGQFANVQISDIRMGGEDISKPISVNFSARFEQVGQEIGGKIYLPIMVEKFFEDNPLKSVTRTFPVQLPYPVKSEYIFNLTIPDGYAVEYIPESEKLVIEGGPVMQVVSSILEGSIVQIKMTLLIKEQTYAPEYYEHLRKFFSGVVEKQDLQIILKKN